MRHRRTKSSGTGYALQSSGGALARPVVGYPQEDPSSVGASAGASVEAVGASFGASFKASLRTSSAVLTSMSLILLVTMTSTPSCSAAQFQDADVPLEANATPPKLPMTAGNSHAAADDSHVLHGKAEVTEITKDKNLKDWQAAQFYAQGTKALDAKKIKLAADLFKRAGDDFDAADDLKFEAQARYAEAQARRLLGEANKATKLYQRSIELFKEYDPLSPYLKPSLDYLKSVAPQLTGQVAMEKARLTLLTAPTRIVTVDRNVTLKAGLSEYGSNKLMAQKAVSDVSSNYVQNTIHKAFLRMTCLETAELGSNDITAENRWYPLITDGRTVTMSTTSDFMAPAIKVKINARYYNVTVDLPELGSNRRTVFLLTDGSHIVAIDPATEDMWSLVGDFSIRKRNSPGRS